MSQFTKINLKPWKEMIDSGKEKDDNGNFIHKCEKGSIGRFIKDFQKNNTKIQVPNSMYFPNARFFLYFYKLYP